MTAGILPVTQLFNTHYWALEKTSYQKSWSVMTLMPLLFFWQYLRMMESLSSVSQPVQQKHLGLKKDVEEKDKDGKPLVMKRVTDEGKTLCEDIVWIFSWFILYICRILIFVSHTQPPCAQARKWWQERLWTGGTSGSPAFTTHWEGNLFTLLVMTSVFASLWILMAL